MTAEGPGRAGSDTKTELLDAAERLMLAEGYAAVTARRVAAEANANPGLVHYYFGRMDDLFLALFRRRADRNLERQRLLLDSPQPLWALWDFVRDEAAARLNLEFLALGNHRTAIRAEIKAYSMRFRRQQVRAVRAALARHGVDAQEWSPAAVVLLVDGMARHMATESSYDLSAGHTDMVSFVEHILRQLEGEPVRGHRWRRGAS